MTIQEEAKQICEKMRKMLDDEFMYPVKQSNGVFAYQQHVSTYPLAREIFGYINGFADALGVKITNHAMIAIREPDSFETSYLLSIEFLGGMAY